MAIDTITGTENNPDVIDTGSITEVEIEPTDAELLRNAAEILVTESELVLDDEVEELPQIDFDANLVDELTSSELLNLASSVVRSIKADKESRKDWEETYIDGLKYLGMKFEKMRSQPFEGSSGVIHPILAESVTQFQAQAYKELLPATGPVKTEVIGARTAEVDAQAERVQQFMNFYIMNVMQDYDPELDMLLFYLPIAGSAFKKVYYDVSQNRAISKFIEPENLIVPYDAADLSGAERVTHVLSMSKNEIKKQQLSGFYANIELTGDGGNITQDEIEKTIDDIEGTSPTYMEERDRTVFEVHTVLDLPNFEDTDESGKTTGLKLPYIVTIDEPSQKVLSIRRNYRPDDPLKNKINYFVQYKFLPGLGFYGLGLSHMIGGLSKASTSILRQLIDAGTLANLPAGFKARGMRIRDEDEPLQPGEFRDIDTTGSSLRENLIPLPIKEPSNVLMSLLGLLVESGKRFASIADMNVGDMNQAMPVGTTVALLERGTKVMSAIHKRLHYAQRLEFQLLARVFQEYLPPVYPYVTGSAPQEIKSLDFDDRVDVVPVSDPNIFSQSQRITMAQELLAMVQSNPEIHGPNGIYEAYRRMYAALGVDDVESLLQPPAEPQPPQPVEAGLENAALILGQPAQAFPEQDHIAHINAHRSLFMTKVVTENPALQGQLIAHMMQHLQFLAEQIAVERMPEEIVAQQTELQALIESGQAVPPDLIQAVVQLGQQAQAQIAAPILAEMSGSLITSLGQDNETDPLVEIRQRELDLREKQIELDNDQFAAKQGQRAAEQEAKNVLEKERIDTSRDIAKDKLDVAIARLDQQANLKLLDLQNKRGAA
ncbi:MAG TPA: hypothetical protein DCW74_13610 [Alteromonas australica]|mgnify:CR=1 FL=1|uniref:Portal protein n=1 Tax=Alteromonas australica TaxID=589873 RepID=A0A350P642_9ALTE|nr:hypothetical protein [Alteromonas australica]|tara:strand:+ start:1235 stop:3727 length:2493 start_codon:yes stop_codon:yes gene_type:complete